MFYSTYGAGKLRISRVTSTKTNFINHCLTLISRIINQGGNVNTSFKTLFKTFFRHFETFTESFPISLEFIESICT